MSFYSFYRYIKYDQLLEKLQRESIASAERGKSRRRDGQQPAIKWLRWIVVIDRNESSPPLIVFRFFPKKHIIGCFSSKSLLTDEVIDIGIDLTWNIADGEVDSCLCFHFHLFPFGFWWVIDAKVVEGIGLFNQDLWDKGIIIFLFLFFFLFNRSVEQLDFLHLTTLTASFEAFLTNGVVTIGTGFVGDGFADGTGERDEVEGVNQFNSEGQWVWLWLERHCDVSSECGAWGVTFSFELLTNLFSVSRD